MLVGQSISQSVSYFPRFSAPAHLFVMVRGVLDLCIDPVRCMENMLKMSAKHRLGPVTGLDTRHNSRRQLGRGSNAKTAHNSGLWWTDACPRLKMYWNHHRLKTAMRKNILSLIVWFICQYKTLKIETVCEKSAIRPCPPVYDILGWNKVDVAGIRLLKMHPARLSCVPRNCNASRAVAMRPTQW